MHSIASLRQRYRDSVNALAFADVNAWVGAHPDPLVHSAPRLGDLALAARQAGIGEVVVCHTDSLFLDPWEGNERLLRECESARQSPGALSDPGSAASRAVLFHAAICLVPDAPPSSGTAAEPHGAYLDAYIARGARLARLSPKSHGFSLAEWCCGGLLASLEQRRVPVMIRHTEAAWEEISDLCARHPALPVIVDGADQKLFYHNRLFEALLARHRCLLLETHNLVHCLGVDALVRRFGAPRFLFGSGMPQRNANAALAMVAAAQLGDEERQQVAGGNWRQLAQAIRQGGEGGRRDG